MIHETEDNLSIITVETIPNFVTTFGDMPFKTPVLSSKTWGCNMPCRIDDCVQAKKHLPLFP